MGERRKHRSADIPLLDEVNELIEKERILLGLQLLEQKQEAQEWKAKYDSLVGKVSDNIVETDFEALEYAAETLAETHIDYISQFDLNVLLKNQVHPWVVDLSHTNIEPTILASTIKSLFGNRAAGSDISVARLSHCGLTDESAAALMQLFRHNEVHGIDLSHNNLSEVFFLQMVEVMKNRRRSPQYLLLDNNVPMSVSVKHFPALVDTLSDAMWGITVSLEDFPSHVASHRAHHHHHTANHASVNDYKETSKNPMKSFEFVNALRQLWLPEGEKDTQTGKKSKSKPKPGKTHEGTHVARGRPHPLQGLSVLGLRHCHLSKKTVACLEATLKLTMTSLTDLDLSFALTGYAGADMLRKILALKDCQLVRLSLIGNALGDAGVKLLSPSIQNNKSLTYLDLRSNDISNAGLRSLESALTRNSLLFRVDLSNNKGISLQASNALLQLLRSHGAEVQCIFSASPSSTASAAGQAASSDVIFRSPSKVRHTVPLDRPTLLHTIDFNKLNANYPDLVDLSKAIDWLWRPVQTNKHLSVLDKKQVLYGSSGSGSDNKTLRSSLNRNPLGSTSAGPAAAAHPVGDDAYLGLNQFSLSFEVRVSSAMGGPARASTLSPSSCVTRSAVSDGTSHSEGSNWIRSRVVLAAEELPEKGTVDIFVVIRDKSGSRPVNSGGDCVVFEGSSLCVSVVPVLDSYPLYSEEQRHLVDSSVLPGRLLSASLLKAVAAAGRGTVLRVFKWSTHYPQVHLQCDLKLGSLSTTAETPSAPAVSVDPSLPPQHETLGYEWFVTVYSIDGCSHLVASGRCLGSANPLPAASTSAAPQTGAAAPLAVLEAWMWRRIAADLQAPAGSSFHLDDVILFSARPVSTQVKYPPALLKRCQVLLQHCSLSTSLAVGDAAATADGREKPEEADDLNPGAAVAKSGHSDLLVNLLQQESPYLSYVHNDENCVFPA